MHTQLDDPSEFGHGPALEDLSGSEDEKHAEIQRQLQALDATHGEHKRALILYCSHIGGHKYAGNVIVRADGIRASRLLADRFHLNVDQHAEGGIGVVRTGDPARGGRDREGDDCWGEDFASTPPGWDEPLVSGAQDPQRLVARASLTSLDVFSISHIDVQPRRCFSHFPPVHLPATTPCMASEG